MAEYIERDIMLAKFIEGDGDDDFTIGYNFAVNEYRDKLKAMPAADVQPVNQWISCKDKMPEDNTSVLFVYVSENGVKSVHYGYHTTIRGVYSGWSKTSGGWEYSDEEVTHWQPIPEPPVND